MRVLRWFLLLLGIYAGIVTLFESLIGYFQPANARTLVITTTDASGERSGRVLARLEDGGQLYVAANHWPRAWYRAALANPQVSVTLDGEAGEYQAVPVTGAEHDRLMQTHAHGLGFKLLTGFPPRKFLRLDPRET